MELPQEIEAFYVIPAVRRELARILVADGLTQRAVAQRLGVTEAAVSQYRSNKRGTVVEYPADVVKELRAAADTLRSATDDGQARAAVERACTVIRSSRVMCDLHRKHSSVKDGCKTCYE